LVLEHEIDGPGQLDGQQGVGLELVAVQLEEVIEVIVLDVGVDELFALALAQTNKGLSGSIKCAASNSPVNDNYSSPW
jgi:hypothetical protein